jgi:hypothetical protein
MTSTTKTNKWVEHIKDYASKNSMSYREAMRNEGCKSAYKMPMPELVRSPSPPPSPEPEPLSCSCEAETPILKKEKKIRKKREPKMIPT